LKTNKENTDMNKKDTNTSREFLTIPQLRKALASSYFESAYFRLIYSNADLLA